MSDLAPVFKYVDRIIDTITKHGSKVTYVSVFPGSPVDVTLNVNGPTVDYPNCALIADVLMYEHDRFFRHSETVCEVSARQVRLDEPGIIIKMAIISTLGPASKWEHLLADNTSEKEQA